MGIDRNIQLLRVISMFSILLCHFCNEIGNSLGNALGQFFNIGVYIFLIISGYLFGKKDINNVHEWYKKRFLRIFIPLWIWVFVVNIIYLIEGSGVSLKNIVIYIFNVQGFFSSSQGLGHLWFLSLIMICYIITPILNRMKTNISNKKNKRNYVITFILLVIGSFSVSYINLNISFFLVLLMLYTFTYYYSYFEDKFKLRHYKAFVFIIIIFISIVIRVLSRKAIDGSVLYTNIVLITQSAIAMCIFLLFKKINISYKNKILKKIVDDLDKKSLYVYIVHYIFCVGPLEIIMTYSNLYFIQVISTIIFSYIIASCLYYIVEKINYRLLGFKRN